VPLRASLGTLLTGTHPSRVEGCPSDIGVRQGQTGWGGGRQKGIPRWGVRGVMAGVGGAGSETKTHPSTRGVGGGSLPRLVHPLLYGQSWVES
jgi:hypothetical protein